MSKYSFIAITRVNGHTAIIGLAEPLKFKVYQKESTDFNKIQPVGNSTYEALMDQEYFYIKLATSLSKLNNMNIILPILYSYQIYRCFSFS